MNTDKNRLISELDSCKNIITSAKLPTWEELPKLELYMDQVVALLNDYLGFISEINPDEKSVTSSMINNYVKMKIIPAPNKKKYSRIHFSRLIMICSLKKSLNISTIYKLLPETLDEEENRKVYNAFVKSRRVALDNGLKMLEAEFEFALSGDNEIEIGDMITRMAVATDLYKIFAEKFAQLVFESDEKEVKKEPKKAEKSDKKSAKHRVEDEIFL